MLLSRGVLLGLGIVAKTGRGRDAGAVGGFGRDHALAGLHGGRGQVGLHEDTRQAHRSGPLGCLPIRAAGAAPAPLMVIRARGATAHVAVGGVVQRPANSFEAMRVSRILRERAYEHRISQPATPARTGECRRSPCSRHRPNSRSRPVRDGRCDWSGHRSKSFPRSARNPGGRRGRRAGRSRERDWAIKATGRESRLREIRSARQIRKPKSES